MSVAVPTALQAVAPPTARPPPPKAPPGAVASSTATRPPPPPGNYVAQIQALEEQVLDLRCEVLKQVDAATQALKEANEKIAALTASLDAVNKRIDVASHFWRESTE